ncbi:hypothetical protein LOK49_LG04G00610 [Camellia lanceoleosa]|uniref:Uncharacterized protein n=1 Tax=Camellia lanceoleosa TaxID=1840588 RepID=A0ACC0HYQ1_9ERIC|nr:hypothetical protein LOK49_LG04G00610 [Camellia lanceoleosa]
MRLAQGNVSSVTSASSGNHSLRDKKDVKGIATSATTDKLKASNFPALLLRIGQWELARLPHFFKEMNPQPRKHTLWQATADFTNGQASIHSNTTAKRRPIHSLRRLTVMATQGEFRSASIWFCPFLHLFIFPLRNWSEFLGAPAYQQTASNWQHFLQCTQGLLNKYYEKLI